MADLEGSVAVVTGASRGLGRAIADELGHGGAKVVVNYSRSQEPADELVEHLKESGTEAVAIQADVSDAEQAEKLVNEAVENFGRIDILVNNAGMNRDKTLKKMEVEDWNQVIQVDLNSAFYTVHAALPHMIEQESGRIINMSSFVGEAGNVGQANYAAAKAGLLGFHQDRRPGTGPLRHNRKRHLPRLYRDGHGRGHTGRSPGKAAQVRPSRPLRPARGDSPRRPLPGRRRRLHNRPVPRHKRRRLHKDLNQVTAYPGTKTLFCSPEEGLFVVWLLAI